MALFGSGPRSNILQTVAPMYQGMVDAEKQKGVAMREAMGAFGKAIDPKTIGMRKFKQEFANADWTKPETFFAASKALSFDPSAAMDMAARGQQLQASLAPKTYAPTDLMKNATALFPKDLDKRREWMLQQTAKGAPKTQAPTDLMKNATALFPEDPDKRREWMLQQTAKGAPKTQTPTELMKNATALFPEDPDKRREWMLQQTAKGGTTEQTAAQRNLNAFNAEVSRLEDKYADDPDKLKAKLRETRSLFNIDESTASQEYAKLKVAKLGEQQEEFSNTLQKSKEQLATITQSLSLLDEGLYTGFGGDLVADITALGASLGFTVPDAAAGAEQFRVNSMKNIMDWIAGTKGAISEKEMTMFEKASAALSRTVEGNRLILSTAERVAEWKQQRALAYNNWVSESSANGNVPDYLEGQRFINQWEEGNALVAPTPSEIKAAREGTKTVTTTALPDQDVTKVFVEGTGSSNAVPTRAQQLRSKVPETELSLYDNFVAAGHTALSWKYMTEADKALFK